METVMTSERPSKERLAEIRKTRAGFGGWPSELLAEITALERELAEAQDKLYIESKSADSILSHTMHLDRRVETLTAENKALREALEMYMKTYKTPDGILPPLGMVEAYKKASAALTADSEGETATTCGPAPKVGFRSEGKDVGGWVEYEMEVEEIISNPNGIYSSTVTKQVRLRPLNKPAAIQGCDSEKDTPISKPSASAPSTANISAPDPANSTPSAQMLADAIDTIMDEFDFAKVHKMMKAVDWRWARCGFEVPDEWDIRKMARQQLRDAAASKSGFVSSGGFESRRYEWGMSLKFVGAEWDAEFVTPKVHN
jgi:hypothetical protein